MAGLLFRPSRKGGYFQLVERGPLWDPLFRYENLRLRTPLKKRGVTGLPPSVPLLAPLSERLNQNLEDVFSPQNGGYHFATVFDSLESLRDVTVSVYPEKAAIVSLGSRGNPLWLWEVFVFFVGWLPGLTGVPIPGWTLTQLEINRDHLLEKDVGPLEALTRSVQLSPQVRAIVKIYTHERDRVLKGRAEVRLHGELAADVLLDEARAQLRWSERLSGVGGERD